MKFILLFLDYAIKGLIKERISFVCLIKDVFVYELQVGEKFRSRALKFPGLISGCTMNWFWRWPKDALYEVSDHFLKKYKVMCSAEVKQQLMEVMGDIHHDVNDVCMQYFDR